MRWTNRATSPSAALAAGRPLAIPNTTRAEKSAAARAAAACAAGNLVVPEEVPAPAGWYLDHSGIDQLRWWDGQVWTDRKRAADPAIPEPPQT